ncbi:MAG: LacI family DNA-binding transcriptional regulator [Rectinemataceae bacterium]|jgi:DNA-binding LacI/PurR family transcriptional regulator
MASIKDVARLAGVSVPTVSRVLSNSAPVDEETRRKVEHAIKTINFRPNLLAQGLRSKSGSVIGLVVPEILNETFSRFITYTEKFVTALGYTLVVGSTNGNPEAEGIFIDSLIRRHVNGIIFSRVSDKSRVLRVIEKWNIPTVIIDRALDQEDIPTVVLDNYRAGAIAAEHLTGLGHRKFAVITGPQDISLCRERLKGFIDVLERQGMTLMQRNVFEGDFKFASGIEAGNYYVANHIEFTALWAENDQMAIGAMNTLIRGGKDIPRDVSILGMDNISSSEMVIPSLSTVTQPFGDMCRKAVDLIVAMRDGVNISENRFALPPNLIIRESTARLIGAE